MNPYSGHILLVDDEPAFQRLGAAWLQGLGFRVTLAGDVDSALQSFREARPDVVLLDLVMPPSLKPEAGLSLLEAFREVPVIVITGHADHALALEATERGAWDFIAKPVDPELLRLIVGRAVQKARLEQEVQALKAAASVDEDYGIVGHAAPVRALRDMIRRVGPTRLSVVILGPTGTGKELVARALHKTGARNGAPFVAVHCGAVPAELLESELFGHLKGSFTGAHRDQPGLLASADGGTLFLDEVGEMPAPMQVKLLRFLQEGTYLPVGGRELKRADVRVVAATHRDLPGMVADGSFREDLFYRLKGIVLRTPPLDERRDDVPLLATLFLKRAVGARRRAQLAPDAAAWLAGQPWPGNVRELQSLMDCAAALAEPNARGEVVVGLDALLFAQGSGDGSAKPEPEPRRQGLDEAIAELEVRMITAALNATNNNRSESARLLGISRVGLLKKLDRLGLRQDHPAAER
ncbi:two-component system NtrC family response regulator [Panacagrimonas perspica]|uniref:Two-component system NtrC family response regulator n=1 Tax=Panacagrimonas perspica TaxID=381431 RepID=A0A4S3JYX1_9GAMM|nr:sigma-54 dependent transcriptional regulator [Panacagrimonas perspica]TDU31382.1 two-component system NtrC family response regulator [Panacagrimonas perspica]THD00792.1 sigma-54-dependent Fis family transcriptional regulator [Panacagrimonas perspica]